MVSWTHGGEGRHGAVRVYGQGDSVRRLGQWTGAGIVMLMLVGLLAVPAAPVAAASDYYADTGHYLYGQFRDYWNGNGGLLRFGFPITKVFNAKSENGQTYPTQYLQRAVFEQHPENKGTQFEVLGRRLAALQTTDRAKTDPNFQPVGNPNDGRLFFSQTNHTIGGSDPGDAAIRSYWESAGNGNLQQSVQIFGYPISQPFDEQNAAPPAGDGQKHRVQYFERYRLEYHPENKDPFRVLLGLLGVSQADADAVDASLRNPEPAGQPQPDCIGQGPCGVPSNQPLPKSFAGLHVGDGGDGYGFNVDSLGLDGTSRDKLFSTLSDVQFGWMRQQIRWCSYEPAKGQFGNNYVAQVDAVINAAAARGVKIMLSPVCSPDWTGAGGGLPKNPQDMGDLMKFMADRYKGKVQAYEIWNEQNYAYETGGTVNVGAYIPVLKAGYQALKASDPNITVVFGGLTPTGVTGHPEIALDDVQYLQQIYAINGGEVKQYYDVLGAHPGSNCNPPDNAYPDNPATTPCGNDADGGRSFTKDNSFYFKRIVQLRGVMEQNGESGKKMWLTEFGWDSTQNPPAGYEYAKYISEDQQAQNLTRAFALGKSYAWMGVMFVWNLNFQVTVSNPGDEKYGWGVIRNDWSARPAYTALKSMPK
jgi:polysaccharide biosynthesis protein PslG